MIYSLSFEEENLFSLSIFTIYFELVNGFMLYFLAPAVHAILHATRYDKKLYSTLTNYID